MIAKEYVEGISRRLREHGYDEGTMMLYITGGGGCLVKNFGKVSADRIWDRSLDTVKNLLEQERKMEVEVMNRYRERSYER